MNTIIFKNRMVENSAMPSFDAKGKVIREGRQIERLELIKDPRFAIAIKQQKDKGKFFPSADVLTGRYIPVVDDQGSELLVNVKSICNRLHLTPAEVKKITRNGKIDGLIREAEKISAFFNEAELNHVHLGSQRGQELLKTRALVKAQDDFAVKTRINDIQYIMDKNKEGFVELFKFNKKLGEGAFGVVHSLVDGSGKEEIAIKEIKRESDIFGELSPELIEEAKEDLINEHTLLKFLHSKGKTPGLQYAPIKVARIFDEERQEFVYVYYTIKYDGDYESEIKRLEEMEENEPGSTLKIKLFQSYQLLNGLKELSDNGVLHGDIKTSNVLVKLDSEGMQLTDICDFGGATRDIQFRMRRNAMTNQFTALTDSLLHRSSKNDPEKFRVLEHQRDVFSMGLVLYKIFSHNKDPYSYNMMGLVNTKSPYQEIDDPNVPQEIKNLIRAMLQPDHIQRITAVQAFRHMDYYLMLKHTQLTIDLINLKYQ